MSVSKKTLPVLLAGAGVFALSACSSTPTRGDLAGIWTVDLSPSPDADPYVQVMELDLDEGGSLSGVFYQTEFDNGQVHDAWGDVVFGFGTSDGSANYAHSGRMITPDRIEGQSYSPERGFVMPWRAVRVEP
ncbi:MAG: hypothetical protein AB8F26_02255 [Phycisphaerales bacterium]